jgi:hypothetical protein
VLDKSPGDRLTTYVVWVPMNRALERDVAGATREVWDPRARQYWDADGWLMNAYKEVLGGFPFEPVWDTYILYGADARWDGDNPPKPAYWMHQLGSAKRPRAIGPFWNPAEFLAHVRAQTLPVPAAR